MLQQFTVYYILKVPMQMTFKLVTILSYWLNFPCLALQVIKLAIYHFQI